MKMRKIRFAVASLLIASMSVGMLGCSGGESSVGKQLESHVASQVQDIAQSDSRLTGDLGENKTIKWLANWDINPDSTGKSTPIELELFHDRYDGKVEAKVVDWNDRYDALTNAINGDEGIDFFAAGDMDGFPIGAIKDLFVPIDDYIDFTDPLFADMKETMDMFMWQGKHYVIVNSVTGDRCVCIYNKDTIEENGLKDPAKLFEKGEWNWDTFTDMLKQFVDPENKQYGIDGWWFEAGLSASCGVPYVGIKDGKLVNNLKDPAIERVQNWMYKLGSQNCVAIGVGDFGWETHPEYIKEGKTLFYPTGAWDLYNDAWKEKYGENTMFVPMPKDPNADNYYIQSGIDGYLMVRGGKNPQGVAKFAACKRVAITNEKADQIATEQLYKDYGWREEMVEMLHKCHDIAKAHPYFDFYTAVSSDVTKLLDSNETGIRGASKGKIQWSEIVASTSSALDAYINKYNNG